MSITSKLKKWTRISKSIEDDIKSFQDIPPAEMVLIQLSHDLNEAKRLGIDRRIVNDTIINGMSTQDLSWFVSDADAYLRAPEWSKNNRNI